MELHLICFKFAYTSFDSLQAEKQDTKEIDQAASSPPGFKSETKGRVNSNDQSQPERGGSRGDDGEAGKEGI